MRILMPAFAALVTTLTLSSSFAADSGPCSQQARTVVSKSVGDEVVVVQSTVNPVDASLYELLTHDLNDESGNHDRNVLVRVNPSTCEVLAIGFKR